MYTYRYWQYVYVLVKKYVVYVFQAMYVISSIVVSNRYRTRNILVIWLVMRGGEKEGENKRVNQNSQ